MPLHIVRNDITKMRVDAIVNAANRSLLGGGGVDGAIHQAAGPELLAECRTLGGCKTGSAKITGAGRLPCQYVIHAVGPRWKGGFFHEREQLISCYRTALALAKEHHCETVAFPLISSGIYGYPKDQALRVAVDTIGAFLLENDMTVYLVIFDRKSYQLGKKLFRDISSYIDDHYVDTHTDDRNRRSLEEYLESDLILEAPRELLPGTPQSPAHAAKEAQVKCPFCGGERPVSARFCPHCGQAVSPSQDGGSTHFFRSAFSLPCQDGGPEPAAAPRPARQAVKSRPPVPASLDDALRQMDESFSEMLLRKIDERGMTDAQCYKKANISRKLFSKIRSDPLYRPSKPTVLAFAIALELSLPETRELLEKAGFALSHAHKFDIIVEYFILRGQYNIFEIHEARFAFDQSLLGAG